MCAISDRPPSNARPLSPPPNREAIPPARIKALIFMHMPKEKKVFFFEKKKQKTFIQ